MKAGKNHWRRSREIGLLVTRTRDRFPDDAEIQKLCDEMSSAWKRADKCPECAKRRVWQNNWRKEVRRRERMDGEPDGT